MTTPTLDDFITDRIAAGGDVLNAVRDWDAATAAAMCAATDDIDRDFYTDGGGDA